MSEDGTIQLIELQSTAQNASSFVIYANHAALERGIERNADPNTARSICKNINKQSVQQKMWNEQAIVNPNRSLNRPAPPIIESLVW